jgi:hypothetical protein
VRKGTGTRFRAGLIVVALTAACGGPPGPGREDPEGKDRGAMELVEITNGTVVLGVLPPLGGRVVLLKAAGGANLLDSNPRYWTGPFPEPSLETPFAPWNGRIVWAGPQSGFWSQQALLPARAGDGWPPDPFNEAGRFAVVQRSPTRLRLRGEVSPVSGLRLEHDLEITGDRSVRMTVTGTNGRDEPISWDLWPNTRVPPGGFPYVPLDPAEPPRIDVPEPAATGPGAYPHEVLDGWLALPPGHDPEPSQGRLWAKAFVRPPRGVIAFFHQGQILLIRAAVVPVDALHSEQAFVEIYRGAAAGEEEDILELEMHGAYETLAPGESMSFEQTFEVLDYAGEDTAAAHLTRLTELGL